MADLATALGQISSRRDELVTQLNNKGIEANTSETMKTLIPKIADISGGTAVEDVYARTRPADWLTMPSVSENEIYFLLHLSAPAENFIAFRITCTGSYTVELGTVTDNNFVASSNEVIASNTTYMKTFNYEDWEHETSDGFRQVMIRVTGTDITHFAKYANTERNSTTINWNIVEFRGNLPSCTSLQMGSSSTTTALKRLTYFSLEGTNKITSGNYMFASCYSLVAVLQLDTSTFLNTSYMFNNCYALIAIPSYLDVSNVTTMARMFSSCYSLTEVPDLNSINNLDFSYMFYYCYALNKSPIMDMTKATTIGSMFYYCYNLTNILIGITNVSTTSNFVSTMYNLSSIEFTGTRTTWASDIYLADSSLTITAFETFCNSLPTITTARNISMATTPAALSDNFATVKTIATDKGWTVTP